MYYTVEQVSEKFGVNPETVRRWIRDGKLTAVELESRKCGYKVDESSLEEFIKQHKKYHRITDGFDSTDLRNVTCRLNQIKIYMSKVDELVSEVNELLDRL